jgi:hypothetical protein
MHNTTAGTSPKLTQLTRTHCNSSTPSHPTLHLHIPIHPAQMGALRKQYINTNATSHSCIRLCKLLHTFLLLLLGLVFTAALLPARVGLPELRALLTWWWGVDHLTHVASLFF